MDFPFYHQTYGKQIAWLFNSDNSHLLGKPADLSVLDIGDFSLYVGTLYDFAVYAYYGMSENEFYVNRIDKIFHLRIPYYEKQRLDPDHFYLHYREIVNLKALENFQNLLNLHFGLLDGRREKENFVGSIKYAYDESVGDEWKYHHNVDRWHDTYMKMKYICEAYDNGTKIPYTVLAKNTITICEKMKGDEMTLMHIMYDNLRTCDFRCTVR